MAVIGDPQRVSLDTAGGDRSGAALGSAVSADGRWVAFTSADGLAGTPTAGIAQLYVRDRTDGRTVLASAGVAGAAADAPLDDPADHRAYAISGDGRYVVFATAATNLVAEEPDSGDRDVFRKDLVTGAITLVSQTSNGGAANGSVIGNPDISFDGSRVAYETGAATNLWAGDAAPGSDIVVSDLSAGTNVLASADAAGTALAGVIRRAAISADGRVVAFEDDGVITVRNFVTTSTTVGPAGAFPDISGDGRVVVFRNPGGAIMRAEPVNATPAQVALAGSEPGVSADGTRVVFQTAEASAGDVNGVVDVYVRSLPAPAERVSQRANGTDVVRASDRPAMSTDGGSVAFGLADGLPSMSLNSSDTDGSPDILAAALTPTDVTGPSMTLLSPADGASVTAPTIGVSGVVTDPSGVVALTVNGFPAALGPTNGFGVEVPLPSGPETITIRAVDGAGRVSERLVPVVRARPQPAPVAAKARARSLSVVRVKRSTRLRFVLDRGATRVTVRLWRRVVRPGQAPSWTPANALKRVAATAGRRTVIISPRLLRPAVYQVRVTVIAPGGVTVGVIRHAVARRT